jgi:hypothetical protein
MINGLEKGLIKKVSTVSKIFDDNYFFTVLYLKK